MKAGYEQYLKTNPTDLRSLYWLGLHHFSRSNYREAQGYFEKILMLNPQEENSKGYVQPSLLLLAIILKAEGQTEQAKQMYTRFLDTQPDLQNDSPLLNLNNEARMKLGL
jgi:cytochrome c-type biogenesis protein CcmH/NrfG